MELQRSRGEAGQQMSDKFQLTEAHISLSICSGLGCSDSDLVVHQNILSCSRSGVLRSTSSSASGSTSSSSRGTSRAGGQQLRRGEDRPKSVQVLKIFSGIVTNKIGLKIVDSSLICMEWKIAHLFVGAEHTCLLPLVPHAGTRACLTSTTATNTNIMTNKKTMTWKMTRTMTMTNTMTKQ